MKKSIITISIAAALAASTAYAMGPFGELYGPPSVDTRIERMTQRLGLNETQAEQVRAIMVEQEKARAAHRENVRTKLSNILTEAQLDSLGSYRKGKGCDRSFKKARHQGRYW